MSEENQDQDEVGIEQEQVEQTQAEGLSDLMKDEPESRLEAQALAAAERAVTQGEQALKSAQGLIDNATQSSGHGGQRLWVLRSLLALNLALMGVMLLIPEAAPQNQGPIENVAPQEFAPGPTHDPSGDPVAHPVEPPAESFRDRSRPDIGLVGEDLMNEALRAAADHRYARAIGLLERYVAQPMLNESLKINAYWQLATYNRRVGNFDQAVHYENQAQGLAPMAMLPEDLIRAADAAERDGDGRAMRRAYARFLLINDRVSPAQRAKIIEAYLRMGDSFRVEAEAGAEAAEAITAEKVQELREARERGK